MSSLLVCDRFILKISTFSFLRVASTFGLKEEGEDIRAFTASPSETYQMLENGLITNSMTILALQWFQLNGDNLRHIWLNTDN